MLQHFCSNCRQCRELWRGPNVTRVERHGVNLAASRRRKIRSTFTSKGDGSFPLFSYTLYRLFFSQTRPNVVDSEVGTYVLRVQGAGVRVTWRPCGRNSKPRVGIRASGSLSPVGLSRGGNLLFPQRYRLCDVAVRRGWLAAAWFNDVVPQLLAISYRRQGCIPEVQCSRRSAPIRLKIL